MKKNSREKEKLLVAGGLQDVLAQVYGFSILSLGLCVAYWDCVAEKRPKDIYHTQTAWACVAPGRQRDGEHIRML